MTGIETDSVLLGVHVQKKTLEDKEKELTFSLDEIKELEGKIKLSASTVGQVEKVQVNASVQVFQFDY